MGEEQILKTTEARLPSEPKGIFSATNPLQRRPLESQQKCPDGSDKDVFPDILGRGSPFVVSFHKEFSELLFFFFLFFMALQGKRGPLAFSQRL